MTKNFKPVTRQELLRLAKLKKKLLTRKEPKSKIHSNKKGEQNHGKTEKA